MIFRGITKNIKIDGNQVAIFTPSEGKQGGTLHVSLQKGEHIKARMSNKGEHGDIVCISKGENTPDWISLGIETGMTLRLYSSAVVFMDNCEFSLVQGR